MRGAAGLYCACAYILDPPSLLFLMVSFDACMLDSRYLAMQDIIGY